MQKGISVILGLILILFGALSLLPLFGIAITISGFTLDRWFPVVFILIGICEFALRPASNWFWALSTVVIGAVLLLQSLGLFIPFLRTVDVNTVLIPVFVFIYGIMAVASTK